MFHRSSLSALIFIKNYNYTINDDDNTNKYYNMIIWDGSSYDDNTKWRNILYKSSSSTSIQITIIKSGINIYCSAIYIKLLKINK